MYGVQGQGWFASFHIYSAFVKVSFSKGTSLRPVPPGGTSPEARWINVSEGGANEHPWAGWVRQAAAMPGWGKS